MKYDFIAKDGPIEVVSMRLDEEMRNEHFQELVEILWKYEVPVTNITLHIWETKQVGNDEYGYSDDFTYDKTHSWNIKEPSDLTNIFNKLRTTVHFIDKL